MKVKHHLFVVGIMSATLLLLTCSVGPERASLLVLLLVFIILYAIFVAIVGTVLGVSDRFLAPGSRLLLASILAFSPLSIIAMASYANLTIMNVLLAILLPGVYAWFLYRTKIK
ncbi:hypothetical protein KBB76_01150 [Candidatus Saccharibacteria bacterium]|jgi:hypothetical protein|nr:hypothetical protein [Candidatus Saccharibacteria bacterium]HOR23151.1 hypothetical protein [Candidatus Saccharibacteria bacterium]